MQNLIWQLDNYGWVTDTTGKIYPLASKPALSFAFDALYLEPGNSFYVAAGVRTDLTAAQITECNNFIAQQPLVTQQLVMGVDSRGKYLGWVTADKAYKQVPQAPYSNDNMRYDFNANAFVLIKAIDKNGNYIGNVSLDDPNFFQDVQSTPPYSYSVWDLTNGGWKDGRTLAQLQADLCNQIDQQADQRTLRFVTPGITQSARYQEKLDQCNAYKSAGYPNSTTPASIDQTLYPYVYWETNQTLKTDATVTGQSMADGVIQLAGQWQAKGGQIEGYRIGGKKAINAATTVADAQTAYNTAVSNLGTV